MTTNDLPSPKKAASDITNVALAWVYVGAFLAIPGRRIEIVTHESDWIEFRAYYAHGQRLDVTMSVPAKVSITSVMFGNWARALLDEVEKSHA